MEGIEEAICNTGLKQVAWYKQQAVSCKQEELRP